MFGVVNTNESHEFMHNNLCLFFFLCDHPCEKLVKTEK